MYIHTYTYMLPAEWIHQPDSFWLGETDLTEIYPKKQAAQKVTCFLLEQEQEQVRRAVFLYGCFQRYIDLDISV